jgi:pilus assembly protein CpaE
MHVTLVGAPDSQLRDLLRATGADVKNASRDPMAGPIVPPPDLIVVDVRDTGTLPPSLAILKRQHPEAGVILVASTLEPTLLLEAMRAGVSEVVAEPLEREALEAAIARVFGQRPAAEMGEVFGFVGAKGGVGATTLAVNIATALGALSSKQKRVLLIDCHAMGGDATVFLGVEPRFSIIDALENTHRLDNNLLRSMVTEVAPGTDLLAAPEHGVGAPLDVTRLRTLIDFVAGNYKFVLLDLPRTDATVFDALEQLHRVFVVANQELATVRSASRMSARLRQRYGASKVSVLLTRSDREATIGAADVEKAVGTPVKHTFPSDYRRSLQALNSGRPVALENHNDLSAAFRRFAEGLAGVQRQQKASSRTTLFGRLTQRG